MNGFDTVKRQRYDGRYEWVHPTSGQMIRYKLEYDESSYMLFPTGEPIFGECMTAGGVFQATVPYQFIRDGHLLFPGQELVETTYLGREDVEMRGATLEATKRYTMDVEIWSPLGKSTDVHVSFWIMDFWGVVREEITTIRYNGSGEIESEEQLLLELDWAVVNGVFGPPQRRKRCLHHIQMSTILDATGNLDVEIPGIGPTNPPLMTVLTSPDGEDPWRPLSDWSLSDNTVGIAGQPGNHVLIVLGLPSDALGDLNCDGIVDQRDLFLFQRDWHGIGCAPKPLSNNRDY